MQSVVHIGRNIKRIREILGIKQETLAKEMGLLQQKISLIEQKEKIPDDLLESVASAMHVSSDIIKSFDESKVKKVIALTLQNKVRDAELSIQKGFDPMVKLLNEIEESKRLYERLLESEKEKNRLYEALLKLSKKE